MKPYWLPRSDALSPANEKKRSISPIIQARDGRSLVGGEPYRAACYTPALSEGSAVLRRGEPVDTEESADSLRAAFFGEASPR